MRGISISVLNMFCLYMQVCRMLGLECWTCQSRELLALLCYNGHFGLKMLVICVVYILVTLVITCGGDWHFSDRYFGDMCAHRHGFGNIVHRCI